jgi:hypothetical protein
MRLLGTYMKRGDLTAPISIGDTEVDDLQNNNFYYEREWRSAFEWEFKADDIEAIMIPRENFQGMKTVLDENNMNNVPIIPAEMVMKL